MVSDVLHPNGWPTTRDHIPRARSFFVMTQRVFGDISRTADFVFLPPYEDRYAEAGQRKSQDGKLFRIAPVYNMIIVICSVMIQCLFVFDTVSGACLMLHFVWI